MNTQSIVDPGAALDIELVLRRRYTTDRKSRGRTLISEILMPLKSQQWLCGCASVYHEILTLWSRKQIPTYLARLITPRPWHSPNRFAYRPADPSHRRLRAKSGELPAV